MRTPHKLMIVGAAHLTMALPCYDRVYPSVHGVSRSLLDIRAQSRIRQISPVAIEILVDEVAAREW